MSREQIEALAHKKALRAYNRVYKQELERLSTESRVASYTEKEEKILEKFRPQTQERRSWWNWLFYA